MPARGARRMALWAAVAFIMAAAFLLYQSPQEGQGQTPEVIELAGDVEASRCAPCHLRIAEAQVPGLIFTHGNHLMISCEACHMEEPHRDGLTNRPTMDSCFNCHGIQHGPQGELATKLCEDCHTPGFELRPDTHVEDWAETPHAEASRPDEDADGSQATDPVNRCLMCHTDPVEECDGCHADEGVVVEVPSTYQAVYVDEPGPPIIEVYPEERVTMGQCVYCHPDVDDFMPGGVIFEHAEHLRRNYQCDVCHTEFAHSNEQILRPDMQGCYRCHGLTHASNGLVAKEACEACHPPKFELVPENHTEAFIAGDHNQMALDDGSYCAMCHEEDFCVECHMGRKELPDGTMSPKVVPADHKVADWYGDHGGLYLEQEGMCGSCHDSASCKKCHQTPMPHPTDWLDEHGDQDGELESDCDVCHTDRNRCQDCHHDAVKRGELIAENCEPCHDQMKHEPATEIQHKGYAEHAVHFDVAEVKGEPYKCYDCHVSFGSSAQADALERIQGHDLRLCYECHGALDFQNSLIAPWKGAALCRRCHADVNI